MGRVLKTGLMRRQDLCRHLTYAETGLKRSLDWWFLHVSPLICASLSLICMSMHPYYRHIEAEIYTYMSICPNTRAHAHKHTFRATFKQHQLLHTDKQRTEQKYVQGMHQGMQGMQGPYHNSVWTEAQVVLNKATPWGQDLEIFVGCCPRDMRARRQQRLLRLYQGVVIKARNGGFMAAVFTVNTAAFFPGKRGE